MGRISQPLVTQTSCQSTGKCISPRSAWTTSVQRRAEVKLKSEAPLLQLHWSSGASDLSFTSARRCTLVVQADLGEMHLPVDWQLVWVTNGCEIRPIAYDSLVACGGLTEQVRRLDDPADAIESVGNQTTAHFCSAGGGTAAQVAFDLPDSTRARLRVVGVDSIRVTDNHRIPRLELSPEATVNGGVPDPYPPTVLGAPSTHSLLAFTVTLLGAGLANAQSLAI